MEDVSTPTLAHYQAHADSFWEGTRGHDVSENHAALLEAIGRSAPLKILDFGCGPGRDLLHFRDLGHEPTGLDACPNFVEHAKKLTGCEVLNQNFLELALPKERFDGIFANASLFHVPSEHLPRVLGEVRDSLKPGGIFFCSNPRGSTGAIAGTGPALRAPGVDHEGWSGERYGCFFELPTWRRYFEAAGFEEIRHYLRPSDAPPAEQRWLAIVWRKKA
ncbi:MAG: class I SAM-dependent methyltransferase [Polyangiaceae bacterium]